MDSRLAAGLGPAGTGNCLKPKLFFPGGHASAPARGRRFNGATPPCANLMKRFPLLGIVFLALVPTPAAAAEPPPWLPRYDLNLRVDTQQRLVTARQRITWINRHQRPAKELVFNVHARYTIPDKDVGLLAKMVELLRLAPSEALSFDGPALEMQKVHVFTSLSPGQDDVADGQRTADIHFAKDNPTALVVPLPREVGPGDAVTVELVFTVKVPFKKGRWGQWAGVTTLAQWLPVLAFYDNQGWQPAPFIPWHQPFFNEAGIYSVTLTAPADQKIACTGSIQQSLDLGNGWKDHHVAPTVARDFALICSNRFQEFEGQAGPVKIRVLALPEHEYYAREFVKIAAEAIPAYSRWFGPFPYPQFTIVESYFGWNGNECGDLVMIDERMFNMPHAARNFLDYLVSHEICHQWWYNVVGTNGYAETWMDEGLATYFSHRLITQKQGKNNELLTFPAALKWLPNIHRDDYRNYGLLGVVGRGDAKPTISKMDDFGHLANLSAITYDRGSKIVGMIEERLGEAAFLDFMRRIYAKYQFQILRVADFQRELEEYTDRSWQDFFQNWLFSTAACDWSVDKVEMPRRPLVGKARHRQEPTRVVVHLRQHDKCNEPCVLGICLDGGDGYQIRIPIHPELPHLDIPEVHACVDSRVNAGGQAVVKVELDLPSAPTQVSVDPDNVLLDRNPTNNHWRHRLRWRFTPLYTMLEEIDVTNAYDRWNVIAGPWVYSASYSDPWYSRSPMMGLRAGVYRTQQFSGGAYLAYRTDDSNVIAGVDAVLDHFPWPRTQVGINVEQSLLTIGHDSVSCSRGVLYGRYILTYGSSFYLPPFEYVETFGNIQNRCLPLPRHPAGGDLFNEQYALGIHYHKNFLTPYWDPEGGLALDATYRGGLPIGPDDGFHQLFGEVSWVKKFPDPFGNLSDLPLLAWLTDTRLAFRLFGAAAVPDRGLFFSLGGGDHFRGFDLSERQGSLAWTGSVEWRIPLACDLTWDVCDHFLGLRNIYVAPFYDVGDTYLHGRSLGPVAHAVGLGLRLDIAWLNLIERTMVRIDVAKTVNADSPVQFWFGIRHPF